MTTRQREMLFAPTRQREVARCSPVGHRTRQVVLRSADGTRLCGWLMTPRVPGPHPAVVYFGGRSEEVSWVVRDAEHLFPGLQVLAVNHRGFGESQGIPGERELVDDGCACVDWLCAAGRVPDGSRIAIVGRSLGSGIAVQVAARRAVAAVVLVTPFDSVLAVARRRIPAAPVGLILRHRFESVKVAEQVRAPVLIVRAERDDVVPHPHTDALATRLPKLIDDVVIPGSDHANIPFIVTTQLLVRRFLRQAFALAEPAETHAAPGAGNDLRDASSCSSSAMPSHSNSDNARS
ncbi:alpha/beta fold hydrolase [Noviherbaspirillum sp. 17J57-3]|uniref:Alpha/beta fold hydrolase n=1 Tax=Noviherbaspirillum galbum TaxID=2709383 RepID=A0A6B3SQ69_9BURK|nr:alpha/beta fold hydrolase [Noviherbaspirillum galbum]